MANSDKNIVITPNRGQTALPNIVFTGADNTPLTLSVGNDGKLTYSNTNGGFFTLGNTESTDIFNITDSQGNVVFKVSSEPEIVANVPITGAAGAILLDVRGLTDDSNCVFNLRFNQTIINSTYIKDSKDLQVTVNGEQYEPYASQNAFAFMPVYEVNSRTFRVRENRLIIYNAPEVGAKINVIVRKTSTTKNIRRYPFSAATIGFGD